MATAYAAPFGRCRRAAMGVGGRSDPRVPYSLSVLDQGPVKALV
jgi:hypothetical protein